MDLFASILLALICITVGFLLGALAFNLRGKPSARRTSAGMTPAEPKGTLRIWRDPLSQNLVVGMDGKTFRKPGELSAEGRRRLAQLLVDTSAWLGITPAQPSIPESSPVSVPPPGQVPYSPQAGAETVRPSLNPLKAFNRAFQPVDKAASGAPAKSNASIAAQIDAILQEKIEKTPLAGRGVRLIELPGQGMVVMVGLDKYTDLAQVPDEQVRAVISQAVAEWEQRAAG